jgi:hypothetical protein
MVKTVSELQYFEFLTALFLNIQIFWYIALDKYFPAPQRNLVLSSSGVQQLTNSDCCWANWPFYSIWVVAVFFVMDPCPEYPVKSQNILESCYTECRWSNELVAPGGADDWHHLSCIIKREEDCSGTVRLGYVRCLPPLPPRWMVPSHTHTVCCLSSSYRIPEIFLLHPNCTCIFKRNPPL